MRRVAAIIAFVIGNKAILFLDIPFLLTSVAEYLCRKN